MSRVYFTDRDLGTAFPRILSTEGLSVRRHADIFPPDGSDEEWLAYIGQRGWIALTHDTRIRYKPNELQAVIRHRVALFVIMGKAPLPELARTFVATIARIEQFLSGHQPPFIAKIYRPTSAELARNSNAPGRVELSYS